MYNAVSGKKKLNKWVSAAVSLVFWISVWFAASFIVNKELLIPSPITVVKRLGILMTEGAFWLKTGVSLLRVLGGFFAGCIGGVLLAALASASGIAEAIITPFIRIIRATPVTSFIILVMLWIGYTFVPVFIAGLLVTPIFYMNITEGIRETDVKLLEIAYIYKFGRIKTLKKIYIPSIKPYFVSAAVTSLGLAWKAGIAAEVICQPSASIGREMYYSKLYLETPDLFAWTVIVVVFSIVIEKIFEAILEKNKKKEVRDNENN